jgi:pimeloyl-ACP methyl ester carboxylesterase
MTQFRTLLTAAASLTALSFAALPALAAPASGPVRNIVLVHGAFADGSGWKPVADILRKDGYSVSIVQEPETSLEDDVAATNRILDRQSGPAVLVGHSYGGAIITVAGNNPHVASLVYVAAFAPDEGEQVGALTGTNPPAATSIAPTGRLSADRRSEIPGRFRGRSAARRSEVHGDLAGADQREDLRHGDHGAGLEELSPSYGIVATQDRMINPDLERSMYKRANAKVTEVKGSHVIFLSQPKAVADVIEQAARDAK